MLAAVIWGLIQGFTEFLPVSSSGHLVIIPAFLEKWGVDVSPPSLAVSAVLHLGTLVAVLVYYRSDVAKVLRFWRDAEGRRIEVTISPGDLQVIEIEYKDDDGPAQRDHSGNPGGDDDG